MTHALPSLLAIVALAAAAPAAQAQTGEPSFASQAAPPKAEPKGRDRLFDPADGQLDLSSFLEDARGFLPVPVIVTEPAVGYGGGGVGMFLRPRREAGEEGWARPDISAAGGIATENGTWAAFGGDASRWLDGRLRTLAGGGTGTVNLDFYGLGGAGTPADQAVRYSLQFTGAVAQANWQLAPRSAWAAGMRYVYADVTPKLRDDPAFPRLVNRVRETVSAPTAILEYDSRDNLFTPTRGLYAESAYLASRKSLGATTDFERFDQIVMGWWPFSREVTLAARGNYAWSSSTAPFFVRPFLMLRGVPSVRYQGDQAASVEVEARWPLEGRWSAVAFGGAGWTRTARDAFAPATHDVASGGAGIRYEIARRFGLHVGLDIAHSPGTTAIYIVVGNAWFRP